MDGERKNIAATMPHNIGALLNPECVLYYYEGSARALARRDDVVGASRYDESCWVKLSNPKDVMMMLMLRATFTESETFRFSLSCDMFGGDF